MKLVTYQDGEAIFTGIVKRDGIVNISDHLFINLSMKELIEGGDETLSRLHDVDAKADASIALSDVKLLPPLRGPQKFLAMGMNYERHIAEAVAAGIAIPAKQVWFNKQVSCLNGPFDDVVKPNVSDMLDYEVELAFVIGKVAKHVAAADASKYIFGYTVCNDISVRDWQNHTSTFTIGKSFDTHGPIGPWIVTADELPDPHALPIRCLINGEVRQSSNTADMVHRCSDMIEYLSTAFTLYPGDLITTGTPEGVGVAMKPPAFLKVGDIVRSEIEGIGAIENRIAAEP